MCIVYLLLDNLVCFVLTSGRIPVALALLHIRRSWETHVCWTTGRKAYARCGMYRPYTTVVLWSAGPAGHRLRVLGVVCQRSWRRIAQSSLASCPYPGQSWDPWEPSVWNVPGTYSRLGAYWPTAVRPQLVAQDPSAAVLLPGRSWTPVWKRPGGLFV